MFGDDLPRSPTHIGAIDPVCDVLSVAKDSYENARFLCEQYYMAAPAVEYETINCESGIYVVFMYFFFSYQFSINSFESQTRTSSYPLHYINASNIVQKF